MASKIKGPTERATIRLEIEGSGSRELSVEPGRSLLSVLRRDAALFVPSPCAGRGACGLCKVRVIEGGSPPTPIELPWTNEEERAHGIRLSCQVRVKGSIIVQVPEGLERARSSRGEVEGVRDLGRGYLLVRLRLVEPAEIAFLPGQYLQLDIPESDYCDPVSGEPVYRAYSIASPPTDGRRIELLVRPVPNGLASTSVWERVRPGTRVRFNGPHGEFTLAREKRNLLFVAGGSGIGPIRAMLLSLADELPVAGAALPAADRTMPLYLVGAPPLLAAELERLRVRLPRLRLVRLASPTDRLGQLLAADARADLACYLCGSPAVVDPSFRTLAEAGVPLERIHVDRFG